MIRSLFFGTDIYAAALLRELSKSSLLRIDLVLTQEDKPAGRKMELASSPVKQAAIELGLEVESPPSLKTFEKNLSAYDVGICTRYGKLIPSHVLNAPKYGILNIHPSLLPAYRGATPIQSALLHGETKTGVSIIRMDEGLDTGPILIAKEIEIEIGDTYESLSLKLTPISLDALLEALPQYVDGTLVPKKQNDAEASYCREFTRDDGRVEWTKSAEEVCNMWRAFALWPGLWTTLEGKRVKLFGLSPAPLSLSPGEIQMENGKLFVGAGEGSVEIEEAQMEGKKRLPASLFVVGSNLSGKRFE